MTDLLVDANSLYARAWYSAKQEPDVAIQHVLNLAIMLFNTKRAGEPIDRVLFAWDGGQKKDKERAERPPEYEENKAIAAEWFEFLFNALNVRLEGIEADDVLATAAVESEADHVIVATGDKDLHQLSSSKVSIFDVNAKGMISRREIVTKWGIKRPSQVAIALAVQGDSADKITGIRGWGPKKVRTLFEAVTPEMGFETALDAIIDQIPADKITQFMESLDLTLLNTELTVPAPSKMELAEPGDWQDSLESSVVDHYGLVYRMYVEPSDEALNNFLNRED